MGEIMWNVALPQAVAVLAIVVPLVVGQIRARSLQKAETYFRLEVEANKLFEIARQNPMMMNYLEGRDDGSECREKLRHEVFWFLPQVLNLFELSIAFRRKDIFEPEAFNTWVAWYFELASSKRFPEFWGELRFHYKNDLRELLDEAVRLTGPDDASLEQATEAYYKAAARILKDKSIYSYYRDCARQFDEEAGLTKMTVGSYRMKH